MPFVEIKTSAGLLNLHYMISTPTNAFADSIDKALPTVIFLHPVFIAQEIFHRQFADRALRRFNLIALDSRFHGETTGKVGDDYTVVEAARDVAEFMDALNLPPCNFFGVSMGSYTALQLAISYPEKVLGLFLVSPLSEVEPEGASEGRQDIYECWTTGYKEDAVYGAFQLGFNSAESGLITALRSRCSHQAEKNWTPDKFGEFYTVSVKFFTDRQPYPLSMLAKISCPVKLIHCSGDIAYPFNGSELLKSRLANAGVDVELLTIKGACHFGNVTCADKINPIMHDFVLANAEKPIPPHPERVNSPWEALLVADMSAENDSDGEPD